MIIPDLNTISIFDLYCNCWCWRHNTPVNITITRCQMWRLWSGGGQKITTWFLSHGENVQTSPASSTFPSTRSAIIPSTSWREPSSWSSPFNWRTQWNLWDSEECSGRHDSCRWTSQRIQWGCENWNHGFSSPFHMLQSANTNEVKAKILSIMKPMSHTFFRFTFGCCEGDESSIGCRVSHGCCRRSPGSQGCLYTFPCCAGGPQVQIFLKMLSIIF